MLRGIAPEHKGGRVGGGGLVQKKSHSADLNEFI